MTNPNESYNSLIIKIKPSVDTSVKGTLSRHLMLGEMYCLLPKYTSNNLIIKVQIMQMDSCH